MTAHSRCQVVISRSAKDRTLRRHFQYIHIDQILHRQYLPTIESFRHASAGDIDLQGVKVSLYVLRAGRFRTHHAVSIMIPTHDELQQQYVTAWWHHESTYCLLKSSYATADSLRPFSGPWRRRNRHGENSPGQIQVTCIP